MKSDKRTHERMKNGRAAGLMAGVAFGCVLFLPMMAQAGPAGGISGAEASKEMISEAAGPADGADSGAADGEGGAAAEAVADSSPEAAVSQWQQISGSWYLVSPRGVPLTGWQRKDKAWYYLEPDGAMATGWRQLDGKYYFLKDSGAMQDVTLYEDETQYSFRTDGSLAAAKKKKNTGGGSFSLAFFDEDTQAFADCLNELKADSFDGDEEEDYYEDDKKDYDRDASFILNGTLQEIAEHRLHMARTKGYGSGRIPDEGTLSDYMKSTRTESGRRVMEVYLMNCDGATAAEDKLVRNHGSDEKKRADRAVYYKEVGIAHEKVNGKDYYMVIFMR